MQSLGGDGEGLGVIELVQDELYDFVYSIYAHEFRHCARQDLCNIPQSLSMGSETVWGATGVTTHLKGVCLQIEGKSKRIS